MNGALSLETGMRELFNYGSSSVVGGIIVFIGGIFLVGVIYQIARFLLYALWNMAVAAFGIVLYLAVQIVLLPFTASKWLVMAIIRRVSPRYADYLERKAAEKAVVREEAPREKILAPQNQEAAPADDIAQMYQASHPSIQFANVSGMADLKAKLMDAFNIHKKEGKNGILFSGDPGNGKTFIAEAFAGEIGWKFLTITGADITSKWVGQSTEQLAAAFRAAKRDAPVVLFFDEVDSILKDRGSMSGNNAEEVKLVNTFLTEVVNMRRIKGVLVIAATNYPEQLDRAAIREGRFDFKIEIDNPDMEARLGLMRQFIGKGMSFEPGVEERIARRWEGFSVSRIRSVMEQLTRNLKDDKQKTASLRAVMAALREVQGSAGTKLLEGTKGLRELHFDDEQRTNLLSLASRLENIDEVEAMGGTVPKGVLFEGPPGTGKTAVAKALAKDSGWAFLSTSAQALLSEPDELDHIVKKAMDLRPCIVFIDEADDLLQDRSTNAWGKAATNKLLALMDGNTALHDILFIAATNFADTLDAAAVRGGRFSERFEFKKPDENTVVMLVRQFMTEKSTAKFASDFTPEAVAEILTGHSPADIKDILQKAINAAVGRKLSGAAEEAIIRIDDVTMVGRLSQSQSRL
jgi:transitional endoplasmic reticulum ATPase